ncbi:MAG: hypothetical protein AAFN74_26900 [Myxococcota bacterium]
MTVLLVAGCLADNGQPQREPPPSEPPPSVEEVVASPKARLRFLGGQRYTQRLAEGFGLSAQALCRELGTFDCALEAHKIVLGGVDAEKLGFFEPLPQTTISTPFAVDRIALSACSQLAQRELSAPERAALFKLYADQNGRVASDDPALTTAIRELFVRVLQRQPSAEEQDTLRALYADIESLGTDRAAQDWATASCFAVATMAEALFY